MLIIKTYIVAFIDFLQSLDRPDWLEEENNSEVVIIVGGKILASCV